MSADLEMLRSGVRVWNKYATEQQEHDDGWVADFSRADLRGVPLGGVRLRGADLQRTNLWGVNLSNADLSGANLRGATLGRADLRYTNLRNADLRDTNLWKTALHNATLDGVDLREAAYPVTEMLLADWSYCSAVVTRQLMRLDAEALPDGTRLFNEWAKVIKTADGKVKWGPCPFGVAPGRYIRVANFKERREHWKPGRPWSLWRIWETLATEKRVQISGAGITTYSEDDSP